MEPLRTPAAAYGMVSVAEALATALSVTDPLPAVEVDAGEALGLVLAEDVVAADPIPAYRASIKVGGVG